MMPWEHQDTVVMVWACVALGAGFLGFFAGQTWELGRKNPSACAGNCNQGRTCPARESKPDELLAAAEEILLKLGTIDSRWNRLRAAIKAAGGVA